jgi:predicted dehydrogenase
VSGSVYYELGHLPEAVEGNLFGPWDPNAYEVEDSAMGMIKMESGATIMLEASWALNILDSREASTTLCGTKAGAEIRSGMSYPTDELIYNRGIHGALLEETISGGGVIAYFEGVDKEPGFLEAEQWLDAILEDGNPLVLPEQAFVVTQILEGIYLSANQGKEILF